MFGRLFPDQPGSYCYAFVVGLSAKQQVDKKQAGDEKEISNRLMQAIIPRHVAAEQCSDSDLVPESCRLRTARSGRYRAVDPVD